MANRVMTAEWAAKLELAAIGLRPGATAAQITAALRSHFPNGTSEVPIDTATGLPYTKQTAQAAGSKNLAGQIVGGTALALTVAGVADGIAALASGTGESLALTGPEAGAQAAGDTASASSAGADAAAGAGASGAAGYGLKSLSSLENLAKAGGLAALLVDPAFLWRMVKIIGGLALAYVGVKQLANAG